MSISRGPLTQERTSVILLTELFPPAVGGTPVLFESIYRRLKGARTVVLTDEGSSSPVSDYSAPPELSIVRAPIRTRRWGVIDVRALAHHVGVARRLHMVSGGKPALVHCGRALPEGIPALLGRTFARTPFMVWAHGEDIASARTSRELTFLMKRVFQGAIAVLANSANTRNMLIEFGVPPEKVRIIYPGVDPCRFHPAVDGSSVRARFAGSDDILVLSIGRHQRRKGHDHAIEAMAVLRDELPNLRYVIAGDGEERGRLEALVSERGLRDRITFVGEVADAELP